MFKTDIFLVENYPTLNTWCHLEESPSPSPHPPLTDVSTAQVPPGSVDSVEFLVKPADRIVLYRSVSRDTLFIYPLQRPVSDQGKIKERLEGEGVSAIFPCRKLRYLYSSPGKRRRFFRYAMIIYYRESQIMRSCGRFSDFGPFPGDLRILDHDITPMIGS